MKVIEALWFTNMSGTTGIVVIEEDNTNDRRAYIGSVSGLNEKDDIDTIISFGNPFPPDTIKGLWHLLVKERLGDGQRRT